MLPTVNNMGTVSFWSTARLFTIGAKRNPKTYNSGDSPVVTHLTTNPPVKRLSVKSRRVSEHLFACGRMC
ncbi:hypothetical protein K458DRAFT_38932 [Lentithecium fluviatile CBS 122367]|uniref:Uncharacterized protein n=1 Tax=Lentithecium fluviatile CBS 122367 TaxID=1168545 RepID=A0A6G1J122_9PLEO|nr:hypothetical protein K458DRAFT_38932 [Lentithecium fluviatile CBS 122367]